MKNISILGSTGSIGVNTLRVVEKFPEKIRVVSLAAGGNSGLLSQQIRKFHPQIVSVADGETADALARCLRGLPARRRPQIEVGEKGMTRVATHPSVELVVGATVGVVGLVPIFEAVRHGKSVALANKEILVVAGELITREMGRQGKPLLPIDSEHCAIHQCLRSGQHHEVRRLILTASGGPFRNASMRAMRHATVREALAHPTWRMGNRITIDSATLMNKGFEVIEARWLFGLKASQIDVLIHPQSTIHSMVEFVDGSIMAQLSATDMRQPIQYALTYPHRLNSNVQYFDFGKAMKLDFETPDLGRFRCLALAYQALQSGPSALCALNAADEVAVQAFLNEEIPITRIPVVIEKTLERLPSIKIQSIDHCLETDREARRVALAMI
ncbi:MAG: 1-deoxy-D-xylulose-5-phosphate reductoisomerase [Acidobacteriia bacterium]|nr:1-deoxy-D-xylulose-5-phosphate reductoisomerase [Terriglobia bacterium]